MILIRNRRSGKTRSTGTDNWLVAFWHWIENYSPLTPDQKIVRSGCSVGGYYLAGPYDDVARIRRPDGRFTDVELIKDERSHS